MNKPTKAQKREAKKRRAEYYAKRSEARKQAAKKREEKRKQERSCYAQPGRKFTRDEMNARDAVIYALLGF